MASGVVTDLRIGGGGYRSEKINKGELVLYKQRRWWFHGEHREHNEKREERRESTEWSEEREKNQLK